MTRASSSHETDGRPAFFPVPLASDVLDHPLGDFLATVGREARAPGGASVAALAASMGAALVAKVAWVGRPLGRGRRRGGASRSAAHAAARPRPRRRRGL